MKEKISNFLQQTGYLTTISSLPEFTVFYLPSNGNTEVIVTVDYQKEIYLTEEIYASIREKFYHLFKGQGFGNVHILTLVLCSEPEKMDSIFGKDSFCWYIDVLKNQLLIPDGHVEDFYGYKSKVEEFLSDTDFYKEDCVEKKVHKEQVKQFFKSLPYVNVTIVLVNVLIFILCAFTGKVLYNKGAFSILLIQETKEYYRFLTSIFLHADVDHLFSNMLVLFFLGNGLEKRIGHIKYGVLYFLSAMGGQLLSAVYESYYGNMFTSVGASGAVFGVIAAVFVMVIIQGGKWEDITLSRMLLMIGYSLYSGFISENVNNAAHIGGFVAGCLIMAIFWLINSLQKKKEVFHEN